MGQISELKSEKDLPIVFHQRCDFEELNDEKLTSVLDLLKNTKIQYLLINSPCCILESADRLQAVIGKIKEAGKIAGICIANEQIELSKRIRQQCPEMVIEYYAEPPRAGQSPELVPIAAGQRLNEIGPIQNRIWAELNSSDSIEEMTYKLSATLLGRMCISGDVCQLSTSQYNEMLRGIQVYCSALKIISDGESKWFKKDAGYQGVLRVLEDNGEGLLVMHTFDEEVPEEISVKLPAGKWMIVGVYDGPAANVRIEDGEVIFKPSGAYQACSLHLLNRG